jgi:putative spermidine/putrescine transport system ATP-binding protein
MARLTLKRLRKTYGRVVAVDDVSLDVAPGEFVTLVGGSGCGKTTLLRMIAGFTAPDSGELHIGDCRVDRLAPRDRNIGFVFQSYALFPTMTVAGNIGFALRLKRRSRAEIASRVRELCELTHLHGLEDRFPHELSGGQQQRVALARALAPRPAILLLDEPLSALDAKIRIALRAELRAIVERLGTTTVFVTHDQEEALSISDRVAVMEQGRVIQVGTPVDVYFHPADSFVAQFIGTSNRLIGTVSPEGHVVVQGAPVEIAVPPTLAGHPQLLVCVRPEHVELFRAVEGRRSAAEGRLVARSFLGQMVRATIATTEGRSILADISSEAWLKLDARVGDQVAWRIDETRVLLFPAEDPGVAKA